MPYGTSPTSAPAVAGAENIFRAFQYLVITDASGSRLLTQGSAYPISHRVPAGARRKQGVRGGKSVDLQFDHESFVLMGVANREGKAAHPYMWDNRRGQVKSYDQLTAAQKAGVANMFKTQNS